MTCMKKYLTVEVRSCGFICVFAISINASFGEITLIQGDLATNIRPRTHQFDWMVRSVSKDNSLF